MTPYTHIALPAPFRPAGALCTKPQSLAPLSTTHISTGLQAAPQDTIIQVWRQVTKAAHNVSCTCGQGGVFIAFLSPPVAPCSTSSFPPELVTALTVAADQEWCIQLSHTDTSASYSACDPEQSQKHFSPCHSFPHPATGQLPLEPPRHSTDSPKAKTNHASSSYLIVSCTVITQFCLLYPISFAVYPGMPWA